MSYNSQDVETYVRPSTLPVLNDRFTNMDFFSQWEMEPSVKPALPDYLFQTPDDLILNYFSILREAAYPVEGKYAGCGTIGNAQMPYPIAYQFLSSDYQRTFPYEEYLKTFENILHISLIKMVQVPVYQEADNLIRYFVEFETIQGSDQDGLAYFAYYYGFIDLIKENNQYKISNLEFYPENYLCAPMHGWAYDAELSTSIRYGDWCSLIEKQYPMQQEGFIKRIYFHGKDGNDYMILFFQLTNDTDIEIAQYRKQPDGVWELVHFDPAKCIENK